METITQNIPMTQLEIYLKKSFKSRPAPEKYIFTSEELANYILQMSKTYAGSPTATKLMEKEVSNIVNMTFAETTKHRLSQPNPELVIRQLAEIFDTVTENTYIAEGQDITATRMLRYMPANWHSNQFFEIYYLVNGNCHIYFPNETVSMKSGTLIIIAPHIPHANPCYDDNTVLMSYLVRSSTFDQVFWKQLPEGNLMASFFRQALSKDNQTAYLHFETGNDENILHLLHQIHHESKYSDIYRAQMLNALMSTFFILLLRRYEGTVRLPQTGNFRWKHEFSAIFSYIQSHFTTCTLTQIAQHFHYSERHICRILMMYTGQNYVQLVQRLKMEKAVTLLNQKYMSTENISTVLDYSNTSSFYRAFSKYYGSSPSRYLKDHYKTTTDVSD